MGRKPKRKSYNRQNKKKVSTQAEEMKEEEEEAPQEIWDITRVVPRCENLECRVEGCKEQAVTVWATNLHPDDLWEMCEECQLKEFGGWPEGVEPPDDEEEEDDDNSSSKELENGTPRNQGSMEKHANKDSNDNNISSKSKGTKNDYNSLEEVPSPSASIENGGSKNNDTISDESEEKNDGSPEIPVSTHSENVTKDEVMPITSVNIEIVDPPEVPPNTNTIVGSDDGSLPIKEEAQEEQQEEQQEEEQEEEQQEEKQEEQQEEQQVEQQEEQQEDNQILDPSDVDTDSPADYSSDSTPAAIDESAGDENDRKTPEPENGFAESVPPTESDENEDERVSKNEDDNDDVQSMEEAGVTSNTDIYQNKTKDSATNKIDTCIEKGDEEEEEEEVWDLKKILSYSDIMKGDTIKCSTEDCVLPACSIWISNLDPNTKWYSCVDCQEADFEGWPDLGELPIKYMEPEHIMAIAKKCSKQKNPRMPVFQSIPLTPSQKKPDENTNFVTPPPNRLGGNDVQNEDGSVMSSAIGGTTNKITPVPTQNTKTARPSAGALAMHKKWQEAAEAMGGKDARIVVNKDSAKKLIFDLLYEAFRPMNITEVYKGLNAVVPSPVLSTCLQDMACTNDDKNPFDDSDEEEEKTKPVTTEPYAGSLHFKPGRNASSNLYYVDHTKIKGMDQEEKNALAQKSAVAKGEEQQLREIIKNTLANAQQLLSEPTNEEAAIILRNDEDTVLKLEAQLAEAQALKVNEKHRERTQQKIQRMSAQWRKRKRICMDFLISLEEITDGSLTAKKCFNGDGPLSLDSDEMVAKSNIAYAKEKKNRGFGRAAKRQKTKGAHKKSACNSTESLADETFVAVLLDSQLNIRRVHIDDDDV